jgi:RNA-splicing ligase RtcB
MSEIKRTFDGVTVEGIVSNHPHIPADESRHVYKSLDEVVKVLEEENIAKLEHRLYPVANIKGA